jgi:hypothetical protein
MRVGNAVLHVTRPARRAAALAGLATLAVTAAGLAAPGAASAAGSQPAAAASAAAAADSPGVADSPGGAPAAGVSSSARFATAPRPASGGDSVRQACDTPARPGQMACNALLATRAHPNAGGGPPSDSFGPADLQSAYALTAASAANGKGQTVAIVDAFNDQHAAADLAVYRAHYGLPPCTVASGCLKIVNQSGGSALPKNDPTGGGWALEISLDLDVVSAICPNCKILLVESSSDSIASLAKAVQYAASHATIVSNSWGSDSEFLGEGAYNYAFNHPGVAILAAAGDAGYGAQYPAAAQNVTAVGGTSLHKASNARGWTETAWSGTGSACSSLQSPPGWLQQAVPAGCQNRTEADVSAVADPNTPVAVYDTVPQGGVVPNWISPGGTSVSTPIVASLYALAATAAAPAKYPVPHTYPASYPYAHPGAFFDVTSGINGHCESNRLYLCQARPGYDGPTGLGSPNGIAGFAPASPTQVAVVNPGTQDVQRGARLTLALRGHNAGSGSLAWTATGLPGGLSINGATGTVSGRAAATGTSTVTVTATDQNTHSHGSVTFNVVSLGKMADPHPGHGAVRLASGRCLHDNGNSAAVGTHAVIWNCNGAAAQRWAYLPAGNPGGAGQLRIHGRCLAVSGGSAVLRACASTATQWWALRAGGQLANPSANKCLTAPGGGNGSRINVSRCTGGPAQRWTLPAAPVISSVSGKCLADPGNSKAPGTRMTLAGCSAARGQKWTMTPAGRLRINGMCLAVTGKVWQSGAPVTLEDCLNSPTQVWAKDAHGQLVNNHSGRCLAVPAGVTKAGTKLIQDDCTGRRGVVWTVS